MCILKNDRKVVIYLPGAMRMTISTSKFDAELHIPLTPVLQALGSFGIMLALTSDLWATSGWISITEVALLFCTVTCMAWLLARRWPTLGNWFTVFALLGLILVGSYRLNAPLLLTQFGLAILLAVALIDWRAGVLTAGVASLLLVISNGGAVDRRILLVGLVAIWANLGVMYAITQAMQRIAGWAWAHYQRNSAQLDAARDHQLQLNQALTDLAHANEQLTRLNQLAQGLRQAAEDARAAKEQFVANVSHELRTPLNMIVGYSETMLQAPETYGGRIPAALLADLAVIHRNAEHLSALIDDVLDLSQIEAGQMAVTRELVPFREIVENAVTAVRPLFASKQLSLETDVQADLPLIFCDRTRIREVLLNLLSNAGRFTEQGGVQVRAALADEALIVSVADTGTGISDEGIRKLFQPFYQVDGSIRRRFGGTGLGLSISKRFIELHDGKIWVESRAGAGSTFFFRLPIQPPAPLDPNFLRGVTPGWEFLQRTQPFSVPKTAVRPRFVVLEKDGALQRLLTRYMDGLEVAAVADLPTALHELAREPAQALLVNTASVSGALEELSPATRLPMGTPVFICSAPGVDELSNELGAIYRLVKPVARDDLLAVLDRLAIPTGAAILIVDDEPDALQLFGRMLNSFGRAYRVLVARDGQEALTILETVRPAVLLLDLIMPHMDGFQLLAERSRSTILQAIPVVIISAQDPARQPIVSSAFAITQGGGLSMRQLLKSIEFVTTQLNPAGLKIEKMRDAA